MNTNELPLQELFTRLREAGLPLGIDEYQLVLHSLQAGFGIADKAALKHLCQTLWSKSAEEKAILEYHFEQVIRSEAVISSKDTNSNTIVPTPEINSNTVIPTSRKKSKTVFPTSEKLPKKPWQPQIYQIARYLIMGIVGVGIVLVVRFFLVTPNQIQTPTQTSKPKQNEPETNLIIWSFFTVIALDRGYVLFRWLAKRKAEHTPSTPDSSLASEIMTQESVENNTFITGATPNLSTSAPPSKLTQTREDEVQVVKPVMQATSKRDQTLGNISVLNREFFPLTQRQMKQVWRYLRRPVREGKPTELDVEATIDQIGQQGLLLDIILVPPRVNRAELMILIDQDGSMVPFHTLSRKLTETALGDGRLRKTGIYYFHNSPVEYLYRDRHHQQGELVTDTLTNRCSKQTAVLIFSDGGAARGGSNEERYKLTQEFLTQLQQRVLHIAWLNPIPKERWFGTTAAKIARLVPMFEVSRPSLQDAISVLRGRPTNFEGRRK
ncbi:hypothetical protein [Mastigocoleus sp. MO_188.B34]|uniref:hypothetical protein n=1 Tax=Mastigocoleus sp. MO_188.B34 TaxID=3036635 RepID=UPI0026329ADF|nr:hypothetical protein [Mastigocoleus sp. MO_188.B34]MDJ0696077.1 hypothetical protein [Mastigocoleus sp. MO_188.B34]